MLLDAELVVAYVVLAARRPEVGRATAVRLDRLVRAVSWRLGDDVVARAGAEDEAAVAQLVAWIAAAPTQDAPFAQSLAQLQFELDSRGGRALVGLEVASPPAEESALVTDVLVPSAHLAAAVAQAVITGHPVPAQTPHSQTPHQTSHQTPPTTRRRPSAGRLVYGLGIVLCLGGLVPVLLRLLAGSDGGPRSEGLPPVVILGFAVFVLGFVVAVVAVVAAVRIAAADSRRPARYAGYRDPRMVSV